MRTNCSVLIERHVDNDKCNVCNNKINKEKNTDKPEKINHHNKIFIVRTILFFGNEFIFGYLLTKHDGTNRLHVIGQYVCIFIGSNV